jgi:hypothetical protein
LLNWPAVHTDRDFEVPAVKLFVVVATKGLQRTKPKRGHVAVMRGDVMRDHCGHSAAFGFAHLAQRV